MHQPKAESRKQKAEIGKPQVSGLSPQPSPSSQSPRVPESSFRHHLGFEGCQL
jgi:hypothetical protein